MTTLLRPEIDSMLIERDSISVARLPVVIRNLRDVLPVRTAERNHVLRCAQALPVMLRMPRWKRAMDVTAAGLGLTLLLPAFAVVATAVRLTSRGPVIFTQQRAGLGGRPFVIYKFRTMVADAEEKKQSLLSMNEQDGPAFKLRHDPRLTRLGRFLRRTSIDELPQLWNVLKGDMSLVGPRPLPVDEAAGCLGRARDRMAVRPGITCTWQVRGRSRVTFEQWVAMDLEYIERRNLWLDLRILLATVPAVISCRGAR